MDGILLSVSKSTTDNTFLNQIVADGMPVVMYDRTLDGVDVSRVTTDDYRGAYQAVQLMDAKK